MDDLKILESIIKDNKKDLNESDTRHKIIDTIIHKILSWPKNRVSTEEHIKPGYADYVLKRENGDHYLFIEAKKEGVYFELPLPYANGVTHCNIPIKKLVSCTNISNAINQVRTYCLDTGCEYGAVTNGHQWIIFKIFERGRRWDELHAFVVSTPDFLYRTTQNLSTCCHLQLFLKSFLCTIFLLRNLLKTEMYISLKKKYLNTHIQLTIID